MGRQSDLDKSERWRYRRKKLRARDLRREMNETELLLWEVIKDDQLGVHFRPQQVINRWTVDFYCAQLKLIVEVDGSIHLKESIQVRDEIRDKWLKDAGYLVFRIKSPSVRFELRTVVRRLSKFIQFVQKKRGLNGSCGEAWTGSD